MDCKAATAAYQRGLRAGVELAKEHAYAVVDGQGDDDNYNGASVEWTDVDAALAEKLGGAANE
jgi:hypothetical protein